MKTTLEMHNATASIDSLVVSALGGQATVGGDAQLIDQRTVFFNIDAEELHLGEVVQPTAAAAQAKAPDQTGDVVPNTTLDTPKKPKYAGIINYVGTLECSLNDPQATLDGDGTLNVTEGRLVHVPVIGGLVRTVAGVIKPKGGNDDTLQSQVELDATGIRLQQLKLISQTVAARGEGEIHFDGSLDFRFNAGPLEKAQETLGPIGELFGKITDKLVTYHVTGSVGQPKFDARPLGIGVKKSDNEISPDDR